MNSDIFAQMAYRIMNAELRTFPFPHFCCPSIFPDKLFEEIRAHLPPEENYRSITDSGRVNDQSASYKDRHIVNLTAGDIDRFDAGIQSFWRDFTAYLGSVEFGEVLISKFYPFFKRRFGERVDRLQLAAEIQLVRDRCGYSLGPHTDRKDKVAVMLFYLPGSYGRPDLGTSIYLPKDRKFGCEGGPHYNFDDFDRMYTADYLPNAALGFFKTSNSFHGVEPVTDADVERDLIQLSIVGR